MSTKVKEFTPRGGEGAKAEQKATGVVNKTQKEEHGYKPPPPPPPKKN